MKPTHNIQLGLVVASAALMAGSVTIPNTFVANKTAKSSEVNENFSAVKAAVNGNANDIAANKSDISDNADGIATLNTDKQKRISATCAAGSAIRTINEDGTVVCETDDDAGGDITRVTAAGGLEGGGDNGNVTVRRADGYASIPAAAFSSGRDDGCYLKRNYSQIYFRSTSTVADCDAYAPVSLPEGATLEELTCYFWNYDVDTDTNPTATLIRKSFSGNLSSNLFEVESGGDAETIQIKTDNTIDNATHSTVHNGPYQYSLYYNPPDNTKEIGSKQGFYGCTIKYSYQ